MSQVTISVEVRAVWGIGLRVMSVDVHYAIKECDVGRGGTSRPFPAYFNQPTNPTIPILHISTSTYCPRCLILLRISAEPCVSAVKRDADLYVDAKRFSVCSDQALLLPG